MDWFRHYHGLCTDPKLHRVSRAAGVNRAVVIAAWCAILEEASSANERGSVASIDAVSLAFLIDVKPHVAGRVLDAIKAAGMLSGDGEVVAWKRRQRDSDDASVRKRNQRDRDREAKALNENGTDGGSHVTKPPQNRTEQIEKESPTDVGPKKEPDPPVEPEAVAPAAAPPSPTPPPKARKVSTSRGTRLPPDWTPGPDGIAYAVAVGLTEAQAEDQAERMRLWAKNAQGSKGVKLDWSAAWQGWCRRASDEIARRPSNGQARASPKAFNSWVDETREFLEELGNGADEPGTYRSLPRPH